MTTSYTSLDVLRKLLRLLKKGYVDKENGLAQLESARKVMGDSLANAGSIRHDHESVQAIRWLLHQLGGTRAERLRNLPHGTNETTERCLRRCEEYRVANGTDLRTHQSIMKGFGRYKKGPPPCSYSHWRGNVIPALTDVRLIFRHSKSMGIKKGKGQGARSITICLLNAPKAILTFLMSGLDDAALIVFSHFADCSFEQGMCELYDLGERMQKRHCPAPKFNQNIDNKTARQKIHPPTGSRSSRAKQGLLPFKFLKYEESARGDPVRFELFDSLALFREFTQAIWARAYPDPYPDEVFRMFFRNVKPEWIRSRKDLVGSILWQVRRAVDTGQEPFRFSDYRPTKREAWSPLLSPFVASFASFADRVLKNYGLGRISLDDANERVSFAAEDWDHSKHVVYSSGSLSRLLEIAKTICGSCAEAWQKIIGAVQTIERRSFSGV